MNNEPTLATLFDLAIRSEHAAREFYEGLAVLFAHEPEVSTFWKQYAEHENGHARRLEQLRRTAAGDVLAQPADPHMLTMARATFRFSPDALLAQVRTLEDAYRLAVDLESSEVNTLFEFLITHCETRPETSGLLRDQLNDHTEHLQHGFPARYRNAANRAQLPARRTG